MLHVWYRQDANHTAENQLPQIVGYITSSCSIPIAFVHSLQNLAIELEFGQALPILR